jgi:hypothetical protein
VTNQYDTRPVGERQAPMRPPKSSMVPSTIEPLPYFPNLHRHIRGVTASLLLVYLEVHHPAPAGSNSAILTAPVTLDLDAVATDLQVSRRTLLVTLSVLCAWWPTEEARCRAARASREFLNPDHIRYGPWKFYSATGSKTWRPGTIIQLRRNFAYLTWLLREAGISTLTVPVPAIAFPVPASTESGASASTAQVQQQKMSIGEIVSSRSVLSGDGRKTRYSRQRSAGLAPASVLKMQRNAREHLSDRGDEPEPLFALRKRG